MICLQSSALSLLKHRNNKLSSFSFLSSLLIKPSTAITHKFYHKQVNERVEATLRAKDKIPDSYNIIYRATIKNYFKVTYYTTFAALAVMIPFISTSLYISEFKHFPVLVLNVSMINSVNELYGLMGAFFLVAFQICLVVFKFPLRIYKNSEKHYVAVFQHFLPWKHKNEKFSAGELRRSTSKMPWSDCLYVIGNRKAILIEHYFSRPSELTEMLKLDSSSVSKKI